MERDTTPISAGSHEFAVKSYATAREANAIQQAYFKGTKLEVVGQEPKISEFNPGVQHEVHQEMVRQLVVTMDGSADNIVERCLDLPSDDFDALVSQIDGIIAKKRVSRRHRPS